MFSPKFSPALGRPLLQAFSPALFAWLCMAPSAQSQAPAGNKPETKPASAKGDAKAPVAQKKKAAARSLQVSMRDGLRFDPPRLSVAPGQDFVLTVENADTTHQTHNLVLLNPGTLQATVQASMELGEKGPELHFVPKSPNVLASTTVLGPDQKVQLKLKIEKPGIYPYVCTFPGHGMVMYGALYVGEPMPELSKDPNVPSVTLQAMTAGGGRRPFIQRMFMPDTGPASIAVALSGKQNYCWDSVLCRLRYSWTGSFLDASEHWSGNGKALATLPEKPWWTAPRETLDLRFGKPESPAPKLKFRGYRVSEGLPEFHYTADGKDVFQSVTEMPEGAGIVLKYRIPEPPPMTVLILGKNTPFKTTSGEIREGALRLTADQAREFTLQLSVPQP
ncbi:MAG: hypothetical protein RLZZ253_484 [Verrucomicrobiota bacterium]